MFRVCAFKVAVLSSDDGLDRIVLSLNCVKFFVVSRGSGCVDNVVLFQERVAVLLVVCVIS